MTTSGVFSQDGSSSRYSCVVLCELVSYHENLLPCLRGRREKSGSDAAAFFHEQIVRRARVSLIRAFVHVLSICIITATPMGHVPCP